MSTSTITLKVSTKEKKRLQLAARRSKKSLNAYVLGKVTGTDVSRSGKLDLEKLSAHFDGRFSSESAWKLTPDRE